MSKMSLFVAAALILAASAAGGYYYTHPCVMPGYLCEKSQVAAAELQDVQDPRYISFQPAWLEQPAKILYPAYALNKNLEGSAVITLVVDGEGKLIEKKIKSSSGVVVLDKAALAAADNFEFNVAAFGEVTFPYAKDLKITFKI